MSNHYSVDLRERAIAFIDEGGSKVDACRIFKIGHNTIYLWIRQRRKFETLAPKVHKKYKTRLLDDIKLTAHVKDHPDTTLKEIAEVFSVSHVAVWKALRRLKITHKKSLLFSERNEQNRHIFFDEIKGISLDRFVYLDESGINENLQRESSWAPRGEKIHGEISGKQEDA